VEISGFGHVLLGQICVQTIVELMGIRETTINLDSTVKDGHTDEEELKSSRCGLALRPAQRPREVLSRGGQQARGSNQRQDSSSPQIDDNRTFEPAQGLSINQSRHRSQLPSVVS